MKKITLLLLALISSITLKAQTDVQKTESTVTKNNIEGHIYFLASDELKGRETGTPEIDIAASYLANTLRRYGVQPANKDSYYQHVKLEKVSKASKIAVTLNGLTSEKLMPLKTQNIDFNGNALYLNFGTEKDYKRKNVTGKLVIVKAGYEGKTDPMAIFGARNEKRKLALEKGAIGIIELSNLNDQMWGRFSHLFNTFGYCYNFR